MKDLLTFIIVVIFSNESSRIEETDSNPDKWYELFITHEDGSTESVERADTFKEIVSNLEKYIPEYRFDRVNIDIWESKNETPENIYALFSTHVVYSLIYDYGFWARNPQTDYVCRCNNCYSILIDENPQTNAKVFRLKGSELTMKRFEDKDGSFWGCPKCKTDGFLADIEQFE